MKYKVGDKVITLREYDKDGVKLFPAGTIGTITRVGADDVFTYRVTMQDEHWWYSENMLALYEEKTYDQGLADAWELAKRFAYGDLSNPDKRRDIFGDTGLFACMNLKGGIEEALAKIEACERERELTVGSIVKSCAGGFGVVTRVEHKKYYVVWSDGSCNSYEKERLKNTGKTTDSLKSLLQQIKE